ncbi:MAG: hypothetical protein HY748_13185 [Elusimicrobia bacterium]|nr:hypothetical protein [Elusimicrobiota bacterium]
MPADLFEKGLSGNIPAEAWAEGPVAGRRHARQRTTDWTMRCRRRT